MTPDLERRRFRRSYVGVVVVAAVWRILYVLVVKFDDPPVGDEIYYTFQAATIADGNGYAYPFPPGGYAATHAPMTAAALAPVSFGDDPVLLQRLAMALYGTGVVAGVGLLARTMFSRRIALVATALAAGYGAFWLNDVVLMSETFAAAGVTAILLLLYRYHATRTRASAAALGVMIGLAGLARAELLVLGAVLGAVVALGTRSGEAEPTRWSTRLAHLTAIGLAALVVIAPWVIRNQIRFDERTFISTQDGLTLIGANCPLSYDGDYVGFWAIQCADLVPIDPEDDHSVHSAAYRRYAFDYIGDHLDDVPRVVAARVGRGLSIYRPNQMTYINQAEGRGRLGSWVATVQFWALAPMAWFGVRRWAPGWPPRWPLVVTLAFTLLVLAGGYGIPRFRVPAEVVIVLAAAVTIDRLLERRVSRRPAP